MFKKRLLLLAVVLVLHTAAYGANYCVTLPAASPVPSSSPDDFPPSVQSLVTYTGYLAPAKSNHTFAYVQVNQNEHKVWFAIDASPGIPKIFYNRRTRANIFSPWQWDYSVSPMIINFGGTASVQVASVLYSAIPKYRDPRTGTLYSYVMYTTFQPGLCDGHVAGFLEAHYSQDGACWTSAERGFRSGGPSFGCYASGGIAHTNTVPVESSGAIDAGDRIWFVGVEGDGTQLAPAYPDRTAAMNRTQTYVGWASYNQPVTVTILSPAELSAAGMVNPAFATGPAVNPERYEPYRYFMNVQIAWDANEGALYISRGYPYPYDRDSSGGSDVPYSPVTPLPSQLTTVQMWDSARGVISTVEGCAGSPATYPNRTQIYKMVIGSLSNIAAITTGTWTLVVDAGGAGGYGNDLNGTVSSTPLVSAQQTNVGRDFGAGSFLRDRNGNLVRQGTTAYWFGADTFMETKSAGPCRVTGLERQTIQTLP